MTDAEIRALHKKYAPNNILFELVFTHCLIVADIASQLVNKCDINLDKTLLRAGCLMHDIGVYKLYREDGVQQEGMAYIQHGTLGSELLAAEGYPNHICRFASCHTGVGLSEADILADDLPIPLGDYNAQTVYERLIMYADKFHSKSNPPRFHTAASHVKRMEQFGQDKVKRFKDMLEEFGEPELDGLAHKYNHSLV